MNENSAFSALVKQAGAAEAEHLRMLASQVKTKCDDKSVNNEEISTSENDPLLNN